MNYTTNMNTTMNHTTTQLTTEELTELLFSCYGLVDNDGKIWYPFLNHKESGLEPHQVIFYSHNCEESVVYDKTKFSLSCYGGLQNDEDSMLYTFLKCFQPKELFDILNQLKS